MVRLYRYNGGRVDLLLGSRGRTWPAKQAWLSHAEAQSGRGDYFGELNLRHLSFLYYYLTLEAYFVLYAQVS